MITRRNFLAGIAATPVLLMLPAPSPELWYPPAGPHRGLIKTDAGYLYSPYIDLYRTTYVAK